MTDVTNERREGTVGVVGAGRVGQWFVRKLVGGGYEPVVFDVDPKAVAEAVDRGGIAGNHPADVATQADVIVLALPTKADVETVMEGTDGILAILESGQVVVDTGTTLPDVAVHYQKKCHERGAGYVDCGITRHGPGASDRGDEPGYTMFVGGDADDYEQVLPIIETLSHTHEFFEGIGNGHTVKMAVVLRATCRAAMAAEVCEFLSNNAIDPGRVVSLLDWEVPEPYVDPSYFTARGFERAVHTDDGDTEARGFGVDRGGRLRLETSTWAKDPANALSVAHASGSHVPMLTAAFQVVRLTERYGAALTDHDLEFGETEWRLFHLRSVYRALARPQEEWRRLSQWTDGQD